MQLLTDCQDTEPLFCSPEWAMEEKMDGDRMIVRKNGSEILASTRNQDRIAAPDSVKAMALLSDHAQWTIDGELMPGGEFVAFDILQLDGQDLRGVANGARREILCGMSPFRVARRATGEEDKRALWDAIRQEKREGGVFKRITGLYSMGRSQDCQRSKFYQTDEFTVCGVNIAKCSVQIERDGQTFGSVASSLNSLPKVGDVIRVRYDAVTQNGKLLRAKIVRR